MKEHSVEKSATFDFGTVRIIDNIIIAEMKEGIVFDPPSNTQLLSFCKDIFGQKAFGYISYRKNSYTVDPTVYLQTAQYSNMSAIAVVSVNPMNKLNVTVEKQFFDSPFEIFDDLEQAANWMKQVLPS